MPNSIKIKVVVIAIIFSATSTYLLAQNGSTENIFIPPTGPYAIGRTSYDWLDSTRGETFSNQKDVKREIMVYVYYPTKKESKSKTAPYLPYLSQTEKAIGDTNMAGQFGDAYPMIKSGQLKTHSVENAALLVARKKYPI